MAKLTDEEKAARKEKRELQNQVEALQRKTQWFKYALQRSNYRSEGMDPIVASLVHGDEETQQKDEGGSSIWIVILLLGIGFVIWRMNSD